MSACCNGSSFKRRRCTHRAIEIEAREGADLGVARTYSIGFVCVLGNDILRDDIGDYAQRAVEAGKVDNL